MKALALQHAKPSGARPRGVLAALLICLACARGLATNDEDGARRSTLAATRNTEAPEGSPPDQRVGEVLSAFDFRGVSLDEGFLKSQVEDAREFYLGIADDDLLKPYRQRAGLPAPGNALGGWYRQNTFNVFGQIVSGLARLYAATGDEACRQKANRLVAEWARCIAPDGYFFAAPPPHAPHYIYDKFLWGLLDTHRYCGNTDSLKHLSHITDWAEKNLDRKRPFAPSPEEWYTLSENLYRAWFATGDERFRKFAEVWEYPRYWDVLARNGDIFNSSEPPRRQYHAYSHVNCLGGAAAAYRATGEPKYLATLVNGFDFLQACQVYATGGYGPDEQLLPLEEFSQRIHVTQKSFETQCGSWAAFKLTRELITLTGDARYGDWAERLSINGIGATIPMTPDGRVLYYSDYNLHGGQKRQHPQSWSCCTGTRPQAVAELANLAWFHDASNLCLSLFTPSTVKWPQGHQTVTVKETTRFPEDSAVALSISVASPRDFGIKIRIPEWLASPMSARVNGRPASLRPDGKHWAALSRTWNDGDRVELSLPMEPWTRPLDRLSTSPYALLIGPTVLVFETTKPLDLARFSAAELLRDLRPVPGKPLEFQLASAPGVAVRPFYRVPEGEQYYMHIDPGLGLRMPHAVLSYTGNWTDNGPHHVTTQPGSAVEYSFEGRGVRWIGYLYDDAGRAEVAIDGRVVATVDQYAPRRGGSFLWTCDKLDPGRHRLRITLLPEANPKSRNRFINVSALEIIP